MALAAFNFARWIEEHRHLLKPPVGNQCMVDDDFIVMIVGGPNTRKDYHYEVGPEFFYQVEGDIILKVIENGAPRDVVIRQGEMFYLPARVPHSPQRPAGTIGMVVERRRLPDEHDAFQWYCGRCGAKLYEEFLQLENIVTQLPPIFERFYSRLDRRTCARCGAIMEPPGAAA